MAVRRLANPVTLCDGHGVVFVAASGQIRMAANTGTRQLQLKAYRGLLTIGIDLLTMVYMPTLAI